MSTTKSEIHSQRMRRELFTALKRRSLLSLDCGCPSDAIACGRQNEVVKILTRSRDGPRNYVQRDGTEGQSAKSMEKRGEGDTATGKL